MFPSLAGEEQEEGGTVGSKEEEKGDGRDKCASMVLGKEERKGRGRGWGRVWLGGKGRERRMLSSPKLSRVVIVIIIIQI